jgi:hypothetical protein
MPAYATPQSGGGATVQVNVTGLLPGDTAQLFAAETITAAEASIVIERAYSPSGSDQGITFQIQFSLAAPTTSLQILGSNNPNLAAFNLAGDWVSLYTSTNKQVDSYTDTGRFKYYCAYLATPPASGTTTVTAQR